MDLGRTLDEIRRRLEELRARQQGEMTQNMRRFSEEVDQALQATAEEHRRYEEAVADLRESRERLRLATESADIGTWEWDLRGDALSWDAKCLALFGLPPDTPITYERFIELVHPEDRARAEHGARRAVDEGQDYALEYRACRPDGAVRWIQAKGRVLRDDAGAPVRMIGVAMDVTESKQTETALRARTAELEAANRELETFSYTVSHDLRTPLLVLDGFSRILQERHSQQLDETGLRALRIIRESTARMERLIADLLDFSRVGRVKMETVDIDLTALTRSVWHEVKATASGRHIEFHLSELPPAHGDRNAVRQVLANLLGNAVKFTAARPTAVIEVGGCAEDGQNVYFVRDNGAGFDMAYAGKLFEVFQRLHSEEEFAGTGVGLAIVKRIVERHGGRVWAESAEGSGATFYFTLPAAQSSVPA